MLIGAANHLPWATCDHLPYFPVDVPTGLTAMRRRRCTGQNSVSKHPTGSPAHGCTYKKSPNLKSIVGIRYGEPDSVMLHLISLQFLGAPLRQKSSLQMNRKLTWEQNPGSCFEKPEAWCFSADAIVSPLPLMPMGIDLHAPPKGWTWTQDMQEKSSQQKRASRKIHRVRVARQNIYFWFMLWVVTVSEFCGEIFPKKTMVLSWVYWIPFIGLHRL